MKVFLDQSELTVEHPSMATALEAARAAAQRSGRVIIEVKLDGRAVPDEQLVDPSPSPLQADRLDFLSTDPNALVRTTLLDVADALAATRDLQAKAAEALQTGEFKDAFTSLNDVVSTWSHARRAIVEGPALLGLSTEQVDARRGGSDISDGAARLTAALTELRTSLQSQDWSTLADLLSGELDELAGVWDGLLRSTADLFAPRP